MLAMPYPERIVARLRARGLDFDRPCGSELDGAGCWLCHSISPWNKVLHPASVELIETEPARLTLRSTPTERRQFNDEDELFDAAYVFSRLPAAHRCVQSVKLEGAVFFHRPVSTLALALGRSRNVRHLALRGANDSPVCAEELAEGLAALGTLESLEFALHGVNDILSRSLADLLRRNASHVTSVAIGVNMSQRNASRLLRALQSCRSLSDLSIDGTTLGTGCVKSLARLVRVTTSLKKLVLSYCVPSDDENARDVFDAFRVNTSIAELRISQCGGDVVPVFEALVENGALSHLCLCSCFMKGGARGAQHLGAALRSNKGLRHLELEGCDVDELGVEALARGLKANCTLETLNLTRNGVAVRSINAFCDTLRRNNTLKSVVFNRVQGSEQERATLSFRLAEVKAYSRVQMNWLEPDLAQLSAVVALDSESPAELHLSHEDGVKEESLVSILENLATNRRVRVLKLGLDASDRRVADALCAALSSNQSVQRLEIETNDTSDGGLLGRIAEGLVANSTVSDLQLDASMISLRSIKGIAFLLSRSTSIVKFALKSFPALSSRSLSLLSRAMAKNTTLVDATVNGAMEVNHVSFRALNVLRRNTGLLNSAVSFVTRQRLDRRAAEAFEELSDKASLVPQVARLTGKTEEEARASVLSALRYIQSNYLRLTGIVWDTVVCHPGVGTQVDALNHECWCAIACYLKVSDVVSEEFGTF